MIKQQFIYVQEDNKHKLFKIYGDVKYNLSAWHHHLMVKDNRKKFYKVRRVRKLTKCQQPTTIKC